jgi:Diaphanous GTPase-binding Domain
MPDKDVLYRSFNQLLGSLDLPDDKIGEMNSYDDHKKWEILCSRNLMKVHQSPSFYLQRLRSQVGLKGTQSKTDVTETLRGLEVSLRTYTIEWFNDFLNEKHSLDMLVELINNVNLSSEQFQILTQCLRVIISDSNGFEMAINHPKLSDELVKSLSTVSMKNRCNVLQLLALACEKSERGHERIFKSLKLNSGIEQLMDLLTLDTKSEQMVIVSTFNLINTVVNSPLDLNYRVYLQFELQKIGFAARIKRLMLNESNLMSEVIDEIKNYDSMIINVNQLAKDHDGVRAFVGKLRKSETPQMDVEKQSINCVRFMS